MDIAVVAQAVSLTQGVARNERKKLGMKSIILDKKK
jgi:hypothetical protein